MNILVKLDSLIIRFKKCWSSYSFSRWCNECFSSCCLAERLANHIWSWECSWSRWNALKVFSHRGLVLFLKLLGLLKITTLFVVQPQLSSNVYWIRVLRSEDSRFESGTFSTDPFLLQNLGLVKHLPILCRSTARYWIHLDLKSKTYAKSINRFGHNIIFVLRILNDQKNLDGFLAWKIDWWWPVEPFRWSVFIAPSLSSKSTLSWQ